MSETKYKIKVTLCGTRPPIWRRILVPSFVLLSDLHDIIQKSMGWGNCHLHQFVADQKCYGVPDLDLDDDTIDEQDVKLSSILKNKKQQIYYQYDFGDGWDHKIILEDVLPIEPEETLPRCLAGKRSCPPEDCGGSFGYQYFLETISDPDHEEYQDTLEWIGGQFDPEHFSVSDVNEALMSKATQFA